VSTDGVKASERLEFWRTHVGPVFGCLEVELPSDQIFSASFEYTTIADLTFCRLSSDVPHRVVRTPIFARRDDRAFVKLVLLTKGTSLLGQNGRTTPLRSGEWSIYDTSKPYSMTIPRRADMFLLLVPRDKFPDRSFHLPDLVARSFSGRRGLGKLIWSLIPATFDQIPEMGNRSTHDVADIVAQMARAALVDFSDERALADPRVDSKEALRERVKQYIAGHLGDADLSITKLAGVIGCTKRYLHMVFQPEKTSLSDYILKMRLERCRGDLLNPACTHRSITDIAYSWGFNSSNHFSRCFKRAFGVCPRRLRAEFAAWPAAVVEPRQRPS
jgi:AraC-like DNA-binding protein